MTRCAAVCFAPAAGAFRAPLSLSLAAPDSQLRLRSDRPPAAAAIQAYVECNLMHDTATYKVPLAEGNNSEDVAMWPVTPYTLTLANHDRTTDVWATLYVDGCKISKHFIERGGSKEIEGIDDGMSTKELLFSFPRLMTSECVLRLPAERAHARAPQCQLIGPCVALLPVLSRRHDKLAKERLSQVGEIKVEATRATFLKKETRKGGGASFDRCARYCTAAQLPLPLPPRLNHVWRRVLLAQLELPAGEQEGCEVRSHEQHHADGQDGLHEDCRQREHHGHVQCLPRGRAAERGDPEVPHAARAAVLGLLEGRACSSGGGSDVEKAPCRDASGACEDKERAGADQALEKRLVQ
jgi:hypothetical protein